MKYLSNKVRFFAFRFNIKNDKTLSGYFRISTFISRNLLPWQPKYDIFFYIYLNFQIIGYQVIYDTLTFQEMEQKIYVAKNRRSFT